MKAWSIAALLFAGALLATVPISPQVTPRGLELSVDHAQAITYGRYRRVQRRAYRRGYAGYSYGYPGYSGYSYRYPGYSGYSYGYPYSYGSFQYPYSYRRY